MAADGRTALRPVQAEFYAGGFSQSGHRCDYHPGRVLQPDQRICQLARRADLQALAERQHLWGWWQFVQSIGRGAFFVAGNLTAAAGGKFDKRDRYQMGTARRWIVDQRLLFSHSSANRSIA